ncbi:Zinc ribbon domain protein [Poriferisphaera corsica]|uniref:Zinc ribbon domain protein n=1 Tax=Poriferisphaera corsica TaxID=2528020 RepID=A0A517YSR6_9BACT|nr:zinc ribbon domain-containing protein [Poriferisphaera corsica]QDU33280.1 Zinc ribbon domain protein [Poriferisphaera corsica]
MPTYDYVCDNCEHAFEEFQMMSAKPLKKCSECGKMKLRRLIGAGAGVIFKGSGFYETDYRSEGYSKDQKAAKDAKKADKKEAATPKSESKSSDSGKADKPAAKKESTPKKS